MREKPSEALFAKKKESAMQLGKEWHGAGFTRALAPLLIRQRNPVRVPHPFPRLLRKWVGKQSHCFLAGSIALLAVIFASQAAVAANRVVTDADNGDTLHLKMGELLELRLRSNPSTGYIWQPLPESTPLLKLVRQAQTKATEPGVGRPIVQVFLFRAARAGEGLLALRYSRPWESSAPDGKLFELHVFIARGRPSGK
jgi:inhibitor of cysteine peptidase